MNAEERGLKRIILSAFIGVHLRPIEFCLQRMADPAADY